MFEGEQYRSYIQLCRGLRLPRVYWQSGDLRWHPKANPDVWSGQIVVISDRESAEAASMAGDRESVWLPRLDQWFEMLEEAGVLNVRFVFPNRTSLGNQLVRNGDCLAPGFNPGAAAPTNEEVAARLWMAVTGRTVTSG